MPSTDDRFARLERQAKGFERRADKLASRVAELEAEVAARDEHIAKLEAENARLRGGARQSSLNSGKPPSSDSPKQRAARKKKRRKRASGRRRGGQPGHKGHQRELLPPEKVTRTRDRFPKRCRGCHAELERVSHGDPIRHQTVEVPRIEPDVTENRLHAVACTCGTVTRARLPRGVPRGMCGPNLMAHITLLVGVYHLSRRDAVTLCSDMFGVRISLGMLSKVEGVVAGMLEPAHTEAATLVHRARAKYADATGWFRNAAGRTLWVIASKLATVFHIVNDGTQERFRQLMGTLTGVLITDRGSQFGFWAMARRQICWAHLIRKYVSFSEHEDPQVASLGETLVLLTQVLLAAWHRVRDGTMSRTEFQAFVARFRPIFEGHLARGVDLRTKGVSGSCTNILRHAEALWTFAHAPGVGPTNNHAERELRGFVLWRRKSYGSQSERGDRFAERVMTVVHTLRKQDRHVLSFLRDTIAASLRGTPAPSIMPLTP